MFLFLWRTLFQPEMLMVTKELVEVHLDLRTRKFHVMSDL